jgi:Ca2+-binding EF-hand superfamily protein
MTHFTKAFLSLTFLFAVACDQEDTHEPSEQELAAVEAGGKGGWMAKFDADGDGVISREEAKGHKLEAKFADLDRDGDGKLTREELKAMKGHRGKHGGGHKDPEARAAKLLAKFDTNGDGSISREEVGDHPRLADRFAEADSDKDGKLSREELKALKGHPGKGKHGGHHRDPSERAAMLMAKLDVNSDGALSSDEVAEHPFLAHKFAAADSDGNGKLSREELIAFKPEPRGERRRGPRGE